MLTSAALLGDCRRVIWVGGSNAGGQQRPSYSVHFTDIVMHAVASPSEIFSRHSIYMQLDGAQSADEQDGGDDAAPEVRLAPSELSQSEFVRALHCIASHRKPCSSTAQMFFLHTHMFCTHTAVSPKTTSLCFSEANILLAVDAIFQALCEGALANPDPDAEDDEGDFFFDEVNLSASRLPS